MSYESWNFPKPSVFEGTRKNSSVLIISSGHSTREILNYKKEIRNKFDVIIACNRSFELFDDILDFHIITEKTNKTPGNIVNRILDGGKFDTRTPRVVNWKGIDLYPGRYNLIKTTRSCFDFKPDIRKYEHEGKEGLLVGPLGRQGFSLGSVTLSAMHFSTILGANSISLIGADMCFKDQYDHFYNDRVYRDRPSYIKDDNSHKIVEVSLNGNIYSTTDFFKESAEYIDKMIVSIFGYVNIYDFSDGLITAAKKRNMNSFLGLK